jgi:hypothetical protein
MYIRRLLIICLFCLLSCDFWAIPRTQQDALSVAERILSSHASFGKAFRQKGRQTNLTIATQSEAYYVINIDDSGFFVISSDDELPELLGYSDKQNFSETNMPPALLIWLKNYNQEVHAWRKSKQQNQIPNRESSSLTSATQIAPLLSTEWGQEFPYNNYCPIDCQGRVCPTGCTTTAIAQIMKYWQWPQRGVGSATCKYVCAEDDTDERLLTVDMDSICYQWDEMVDYYGLGTSYAADLTSPTQQEAIATLMYHIAVSQQVHFAYDGTGMDNAEIRTQTFPALYAHFNYDDNIQVFAKDYCHLDSLERILYDELQVGRPIFVVGADMSQGGHAFVCDGYSESLFHFNWGWYGIGNGWFRLSALNPSVYNVSKFNFNSYLQFFTGIQPANRETQLLHKGQVFVADSIALLPNDLDNGSGYYDANIYGIAIAGMRDYSDLLGFAVYPYNSEDITQPLFVHECYEFPCAGHNLFYSYKAAEVTYVKTLNKNLPGGEYRIAAVYKNDDGDWEAIPLLNGKQYSYFKKTCGVMLGGPVIIYTITGQPVMFIPEWKGPNQIGQLKLPRGIYLIKQNNEVLKYTVY